MSEHDERPNTSKPRGATLESPAQPSTPSSTKIEPPKSAMHPSRAHPTMAPPSTGLRLGFTDIKAPRRDNELPSGLNQATPTKGGGALPATPFTFSVSRTGADPGLSSRAKKMLDELRGDAAQIKADLAAQRDREREELGARKIAVPKGKSGRFSAAHEAAFEKMDSIENHPSAFRAKLTPVAGVKRSSSRANLDELPSSVTRRSAIKRSPSKAKLDEVESPRSPRFRKPAVPSSVKSRAAAIEAESNPPTPAKRFKQRMEDDASSSRPASRDASSIPRPKSSGTDGTSLTHSKSTMSLASPTKSSLLRAGAKGPTITAVTPSKTEAPSLKKSATTANLRADATPSRRIFSPGRLDRVKSILKRRPDEKPGSALPLPSAAVSKTPAPPRTDKALPALPTCATTPRRKPVKTLDATPSGRQAVKMQNSPSPAPTSFFRSLSRSVRGPGADGRQPSLGSVMAGSSKKAEGGEVVYPDLSVFSGLPPAKEKSTSMPPPSEPGTFTFRSDHTINFNGTPAAGFGASPGQSSVRHVRSSVLPMPGSFPSAPSGVGNKENRSPAPKLPGISHGMRSKKRHRPATDEEDAEREEAERAAKKRKGEHVPEGDALLAPRLVGKGGCKLDSPKKSMVPRGGVQAKRSPKKPVLSMSRLNMLARPKNRD